MKAQKKQEKSGRKQPWHVTETKAWRSRRRRRLRQRTVVIGSFELFGCFGGHPPKHREISDPSFSFATFLCSLSALMIVMSVRQPLLPIASHQ